MAKPNYSFEKRQRELAKKRKKEGKAAARKAGDQVGDEPMAIDGPPAGPPAAAIDVDEAATEQPPVPA